MVSVRTTRQNRVQSMTTMAMITECRPVPRIATSKMESSTGGNAIQISTSREISASMNAPRKPAKRPSNDPIRHASPAATKATVSETRAPKMTRESTSRPSPSVPSQYPGSASAKPTGGTVAISRFWANGSWGAINGAAIARMINTTMKPPAQTTLGSRARRATTEGGRGPLSGVTVAVVGVQCSTSCRFRLSRAVVVD